jgi:hypothetical protein
MKSLNMRMVPLLLAASLALPALAETGTVRGVVEFDGRGLPGTMVTVAGATIQTATPDVDGRYELQGVAPGDYVLTFEFPGDFVTETTAIHVNPCENDVPKQTMRLLKRQPRPSEQNYCGETPQRATDLPSCADYEFDQSLIEAARTGDPSASELLRRRHDTALSLAERFTIDGALLRHGDDQRYFDEVLDHGRRQLLVRDVGEPVNEELAAWCAARDIDPEAYAAMVGLPFLIATADPRGRALAIDALATGNADVVMLAIDGLAIAGDQTAFSAMRSAIVRLGDRKAEAAQLMYNFQSEAADRLALEFLDEDRARLYLSLREEPEAAPTP